jgi:hypothetical protein
MNDISVHPAKIESRLITLTLAIEASRSRAIAAEFWRQQTPEGIAIHAQRDGAQSYVTPVQLAAPNLCLRGIVNHALDLEASFGGYALHALFGMQEEVSRRIVLNPEWPIML